MILQANVDGADQSRGPVQKEWRDEKDKKIELYSSIQWFVELHHYSQNKTKHHDSLGANNKKTRKIIQGSKESSI